MKISNAVISWTPQGESHRAGYRGKLRVHSAADTNEHSHKAGVMDERAHSDVPAVRMRYVTDIAKLMIERDGLDPVTVDTVLRNHIDEYRDAYPYQPKVA
jgi:hypothetical protein